MKGCKPSVEHVIPAKHEATEHMRKLNTTEGPLYSRAANARIANTPVPITVDKPIRNVSKIFFLIRSSLTEIQIYKL